MQEPRRNAKIDELSPDKLMRGFNKSPIMLCMILSFFLLTTIIAAMSMDHIHAIIDPKWAEQQKALREAARQAALEKTLAEQAAQRKGAATRPATQPATRPTTRPTSRPLTGREKITKMISTPAAPNEIPGAPKSGIGIDETINR